VSPAEGLRAIATALGLLGGSTGWKGLVSGLQGAPNVVAFLDTGGRGGEVKVAIDYPSVQVIAQGGTGEGGYGDAYTKARALYDALMAVDTPHVAWPYLVSCVAINQPLWLGKDDAGRPQFVVNFQLITTPEVEGNRTY